MRPFTDTILWVSPVSRPFDVWGVKLYFVWIVYVSQVCVGWSPRSGLTSGDLYKRQLPPLILTLFSRRSFDVHRQKDPAWCVPPNACVQGKWFGWSESAEADQGWRMRRHEPGGHFLPSRSSKPFGPLRSPNIQTWWNIAMLLERLEWLPTACMLNRNRFSLLA